MAGFTNIVWIHRRLSFVLPNSRPIEWSFPLFRRYGSIHANGISAKVRLRQISAPLNCVVARKSLAHLRRSCQRLRALRAHSAQFKKFKRFVNDEMIYRVTNKKHHGKTWSMHQPMLLLLLISLIWSIMTRRCSLRGLRGVRCYCLHGLSHDQRRYVLCVIHVDFDFVSEVCHDQTMFCVVHVDDNVFSKVNPDQTNVLLSLRWWWRRLRDLSWPDDSLRSPRELLCQVVQVGISNVNHDRTMFCVVHVDYVLVSEVNDQTCRG